MTSAIRTVSAAPCVIGHNPIVTLRRETTGDLPQLSIEVGPNHVTMRAITRHRDPVRDVTRYDGTVTLGGRSKSATIVVNCGAPQPYFELSSEQSSGFTAWLVKVPITHDEQAHILALADTVSETAPGQRGIAV